MFKTKTQKLVTAGLMVALGILLPTITSHGIGFLPGKVLLPMHIPVLLCGFFCGPIYGALAGFILPFLNSFISSMPVLYPNAIIMSGELLTYGLISGLIYKLTGCSNKAKHIYPTLIIAMICGRIVYGIISAVLMFLNPALKNLSVIAAVIDGIPGIIIQLVLIPVIVARIRKSTLRKYNAKDEAVKLVNNGSKTCVVVKDDKIISAESPKGIAHLIKLYDSGILEDSFVSDEIIGKAAAMIFTLGKVKSCYGHIMSRKALNWLNDHNIEASYNTLSDNITNRKGDGICPMEETVADIDDEATAIELLKAKVEELKNKQGE